MHKNFIKRKFLNKFRTTIKKNLSYIITLVSIIFVGCILVMIVLAKNEEPITLEIDAQQAYFDKYQTNRALFLDIRSSEEWNEFHIPISIHIPLSELPNKISKLSNDQEIVVLCRSGNRSKTGRDILIDAGFTKVMSMAGGLIDWKNSGYPIIKP